MPIGQHTIWVAGAAAAFALACGQLTGGADGGAVAATPAGADQPAPPAAGETVRQWAVGASATSQYGDDSWSAMQATGAPDTDGCGDISSAWASQSGTGIDTLTLDYATPVDPTEINIHQTYNPGSIVKVSVVGNGQEVTVYDAIPARSETCPEVLTIAIDDAPAAVTQVKIMVDQSVIGSWNEIDAVELVGTP